MMKDEKKKTPFQEFLEEGKKLSETKRSVLSPGAVEYIHLNKRVENLIQPLWGNIRSKPETFPPSSHNHIRANITDTPWLWTEVSKVGSSLDDLAKKNHSDLDGVTADQHHPQSHSHASHMGIGADDHHNQSHVLDGADHAVSGLTPGHVLTALTADTFGFSASPSGAENFVDLDDVPSTYAGAGGFVVKVKADASGLEFVAGGAGVASFVDLDDVPATYVDQAGKYVKVNATEDGLEFAAGGGGGAPADAKYIVQELNAGLDAEQSLGELATGIVKNTTTAGVGVLSIAVAGTDYLATAPKLDDCAAPDDNTDLNVSTSAHGLCPKAPNSVWKFLDGTGAWSMRANGCHMRETFDGLADGPIVGQGVYNDLSAWASNTIAATSTMNVTVKSGSDKMLTCTSVAGEAQYGVRCTFSNNWGFSGGGRISFKMRTSNKDKGDGGVQLLNSAGSAVAQIYFRASVGQIAYWNGTTVTNLMVIASNTWYEIDMLITDLYCWIFVDGVYKNRLTAGVAALFSYFRIYAEPNATTGNTIDFDDIVIINNFGLET
jgi:hypothetical protein